MKKKLLFNQLNNFIARIINLLEEELDLLKVSKSKSALQVKKTITITLSKLVSIIIQVEKLQKDNYESVKDIMPEADQEIIKSFLKKYQFKE